METKTVKRLVKTAARRAGLDQSDIDAFSGHSLRVGAAQDLLVKGYATVAICALEVGILSAYWRAILEGGA